LVFSGAPVAAVESGPQGVVRQFCQADGLGLRVSPWGWNNVAPLVSWQLEPAWDEVLLITGYEVGPPHPADNGALAIDVAFTVVGQVSALGFDTTAYVDTVTFLVQAPAPAGWRIIAPPPVPHLFGSLVDVDTMRRSFDHGTSSFVSNSLFVWLMFQSAGWGVPYERTIDMLAGSAYRSVEEPRNGDLVVYARDDRPYHVGIFESEGQIVSSTLNAGVVRSATNAFAGDVHYMRLVEPEARPGTAESQSFAPLTPSANALLPGAAAPSPAPAQPRRVTKRIRRTAAQASGNQGVSSKKAAHSTAPPPTPDRRRPHHKPMPETHQEE